jgi:hypothetical protein
MSSPVLAVTGSLSANYNMSESGVVIFGQPASLNPTIAPRVVYSNALGNTAQGIDLHYEDTLRTLTASSSHVYTWSALTDQLGRSLDFLGIRGLTIQVVTRTSGDYLTIGPNSSNGWTPLIPASTVIPVYSAFMYPVDQFDYLAVASGSNDQFKITNAGTHNITYTLGIIGFSALS